MSTSVWKSTFIDPSQVVIKNDLKKKNLHGSTLISNAHFTHYFLTTKRNLYQDQQDTSIRRVFLERNDGAQCNFDC